MTGIVLEDTETKIKMEQSWSKESISEFHLVHSTIEFVAYMHFYYAVSFHSYR